MKYYTYIHASPEGDVFYVGKGSGRRVYAMSHRHYLWRERLKKEGGIMMKIVEWFDTEDEAFAAEIALIKEYKEKGFNLVNITDGGLGNYGARQSPEVRKKRSEAMRGFKHKVVTCPFCNRVGGETTMKRWHFNNCEGLRPTHKIRTTIFGKRIYLGKSHTKQEAYEIALDFKTLALNEAAELNRKIQVMV